MQMNRKRLLLGLLLAVAFSGVLVGWDTLVDNFLGKGLTKPASYTDNYIWRYNSATGKYTLEADAGGAETLSISDLTDVAAMTEVSGDILLYGSSWDRLAKGSNSTVLNVSSGGSVNWGTLTSAMVTDGTLTTSDLSATAGIVYGQLALSNNVVAGDIAPDAIGSSELADNAVDTNAIQASTVTLAKIQNAAANSKLVGSGAAGAGSAYAELTLGTNLSMSGTTLNASGGGTFAAVEDATTVDAAVATLIVNAEQLNFTQLASGVVFLDFVTGGVTNTALGADSVTSAKIANDEIVNADINASAGIVYSKLAFSNNIVAGDIATGAVATAEILDGTVTGGAAGAGVDIAADTITADNIATNGVGAAEIAASAVGTSEVDDNTLTASDLAANSVDTSEIVGGAPGAAGAELSDTPTNITAATNIVFTPTGAALGVAADKSLIITGQSGDPTGFAAGMIGYDTTKKAHIAKSTIGTRGLSGLIYAAPDDSNTITNTTSETDFDNVFTVPANALTVGKVIQFTASFKYSTTGTPSMQLKFKFGAVTLVAGPVAGTANNATDRGIVFRGLITIRSIGASGTAATLVVGTYDANTNNFAVRAAGGSATTVTIDTTASADLKMSGTWGAPDAANQITMDNFVLEVLN
jgi:hypothetical protein